METLSVLDCLCHNLRKSSRLLTQYYDESLRQVGIRMPQFLLLAAVREMGDPPSTVLADFLGMDRTTLTRNAALLERQGYVRVKLDKKTRLQHIHLAKKGSNLIDKAMPYWEAAQRETLRRFQGHSVPQLVELLEALTKLE